MTLDEAIRDLIAIRHEFRGSGDWEVCGLDDMTDRDSWYGFSKIEADSDVDEVHFT